MRQIASSLPEKLSFVPGGRKGKILAEETLEEDFSFRRMSKKRTLLGISSGLFPLGAEIVAMGGQEFILECPHLFLG